MADRCFQASMPYSPEDCAKAGAKKRLDQLLMERGLLTSRSEAQRLILAGKVKVNGVRIDKPGTLFAPAKIESLEVEEALPFVSRGGFKLEKALQVFNISSQGRICLDIGASTGGFTDCLLQRGAEKVYAIDVGYGQLDWRLRQDPRVVVMEKTNIRRLDPDSLSEKASLAVVDVSFISLKKVLPAVMPFLAGPPVPQIIALLKPQFEYKDYLPDKGFKGVVKGAETHLQILRRTLADLENVMPGWCLQGIDFSPITGPKGNREFLLYYRLQASDSPLLENFEECLASVVKDCYTSISAH